MLETCRRTGYFRPVFWSRAACVQSLKSWLSIAPGLFAYSFSAIALAPGLIRLVMSKSYSGSEPWSTACVETWVPLTHRSALPMIPRICSSALWPAFRSGVNSVRNHHGTA